MPMNDELMNVLKSGRNGNILNLLSLISGGDNNALTSILTALTSGFGAANVRFRRPGTSPFADTALGTKRPTSISAGSAGTFDIFPSNNTREVGQGILNQLNRNADIKKRREKKKRLEDFLLGV